MKKLCATLLMTALPLAGAHAAGQLEWRFDHDEGAGFLGVANSVEADNPKPHYPFLMTCSTEDEWSIYISDIDVKALQSQMKPPQPANRTEAAFGASTEVKAVCLAASKRCGGSEVPLARPP